MKEAARTMHQDGPPELSPSVLVEVGSAALFPSGPPSVSPSLSPVHATFRFIDEGVEATYVYQASRFDGCYTVVTKDHENRAEQPTGLNTADSKNSVDWHPRGRVSESHRRGVT